MKNFIRPWPFFFSIGMLLLAGGCDRKSETSSKISAPAKHEHHAPHGGTAVVLGDEVYHLELVLDDATGLLQAYVLDGEMENFVRSKETQFEVIATVSGEKRPLIFNAVADTATGEKVGDTSLFEARADWLKTTKTFEAVLTSLNVRGTVFSQVAFNFPNGNDHDHDHDHGHEHSSVESPAAAKTEKH